MLPSPPTSGNLKAQNAAAVDALRLPEPFLNDAKRELSNEDSNTKDDSGAEYSPELSATKGPKRKNHSEIERRRRIKINGKFDELRELVPSCRGLRFARRGGDSGLHKLDILTEAVDYIRELKEAAAAAKALASLNNNPSLIPEANAPMPLPQQQDATQEQAHARMAAAVALSACPSQRKSSLAHLLN